jgi:hypothetical protein
VDQKDPAIAGLILNMKMSELEDLTGFQNLSGLEGLLRRIKRPSSFMKVKVNEERLVLGRRWID